MKDEFINKYRLILVDIFNKYINRLSIGFIDKDCDVIVFPILVHSIENIDIFDEDQIKDIINFANKLYSNG